MSTFVQCGAQKCFFLTNHWSKKHNNDATVIILHPYPYVLSMFLFIQGREHRFMRSQTASARLGF